MKPIKFVTALMAFAAALSAQAASLLNGLALEQQFNKDQYIAAVYSDTLAESANVLLDNNTSRRLEVRVVADSLSARRFRNQWMEAIAINNPSASLSDQANDMVTFANLFQGRFQKGDRLTVAFAPLTGVTSVALNQVAMGEIHNREFFNTLLRAWIGPVPPSTEFRDSLLAGGQVPSAMLASFEVLEPSSGRVAEIRAELAERSEPQQTEEVATAPAAKPVLSKPKLAADIPQPTLASVGSKPQIPVAAPKPKPSKPQPAKQAAVDDDDEDEAPLTADMLLARQVYHSVLLRHTFKNVRYPKRAQERGQEGSVRLNVVIDAQGHVRDIQTLQDSRFSALNRAAMDAIQRADPYPAAPPQLARDNYQFTMPITFRLAD